MAGPVLLNVRGLSKQFPGVKALDDVSLRVRAGEVMALVGENGAGKSTIVKILTGIYKPDAGTIEIAGTPMQFSRPTDAWAAGISAIHQETSVFEDLTVGENIFMGHQPTRGRGPLVDWKDIHRRSAEILDRMDVAISTRSLVRELSVAERHILGVAKALAHDAQIVIMDEPSASLSRKEIDHLMVIVRQLRDEGKGIIFISHKFVEIFEIADRYAVLRDGQLVGEGN
ncbi:MAG: sugar ABC transporter ATP-binding protein [Proteobacteria bacterium]|nr:sugar ABC transporter ATP-binding protein [Pseudomonadota bacterium]